MPKHITEDSLKEGTILRYESLVLNKGQSNEDWKPAFDAALANYSIVKIPRGTYKTSTVSVPSGKVIYGEGDLTVLIPSSTNLFDIVGSTESEIAISESIPDFTDIIKVVSTPNLSANDYFMLKGQRDCMNETDSGESWTLGYSTPGSQGLYFGEFMEVSIINGTTITTKSTTTFPNYLNTKSAETSPNARDSTTIQKVLFAKDVVFKDFKITKTSGTAFNFRYALNCKVDNVTMDASGYTDGMLQFIAFTFSLNCEGYNCRFKIPHPIAPSQHHYVNIYKAVSSTNCGFTRCYGYNATQTVDFSYSTLGIPCINCYVDYCTFENATQTGATSHGGTYQVRWTGNTIRGSKQGICCRSRGSLISNNTILGAYVPSNSLSYGVCLYEGYATDCIVTGNTISNYASGILV
ncbi:hypothetical protein CEW46_28995, partial [Bacillus cereus]